MLGRVRRGRAAVVDASSGRRRKTYGGLTAAVWSAAAGLTRSGVRRGDVVAVHLPDVPELVLALHAVIAAGAVPTPVSPRSSVEDLTRQLADSKAKALITWPVLLDTALKATESAPVERLAFEAGPARPGSGPARAGSGPANHGAHPHPHLDGAHPHLDGAHPLLFCFGDTGEDAAVVAFESLFTPHAPRDLRVRVPDKDLALLPYTRGTTRVPKAVKLTHRAVVAGAMAIAGAGLMDESDVVTSELPLTDVLALQTILHPALIVGATVVMKAGRGRPELLKTLQERGVTMALLTPETITALAFHHEVKRYDLTALRTVICTESALDPETALACEERIECTVRSAYGLTEAGGLTHLSEPAGELRAAIRHDPDDEDGAGPAPGSVGRCLPHVRAKIVDPATDETRAPFDLGELWVRSEAGVRGWIHTGDRAFADEDGRYYIVGRMAAPRGDRKRRAPVERSRAYRLEEGWW
jgi:acyl-CoA synthetase (AMP-forming)/AMP-acid ligase II